MTSSCLNCGADVFGRYCPDCGQDGNTSRYGLRSLGREIYDQFKKVDLATTVRTFWRLFRRPGEFVRGYLAGKRVGFLTPIKYFFYSFLVQVILSGFIYWIFHDRSLAGGAKIDFNFEVLALISTIFWGALWSVFYTRSELNLVENVVAAVYFVAQTNYLSLVMQIVLLPVTVTGIVGQVYVDSLSIAIQLLFAVYFARSLFGEHMALVVIKQTILTVLYFVLMVLVFTFEAVVRTLLK